MNGFLHINHKEQTACARSIYCAQVFSADYEDLTSADSIIFPFSIVQELLITKCNAVAQKSTKE